MRYIIPVIVLVLLLSACIREKTGDKVKKAMEAKQEEKAEPTDIQKEPQMIYRVPTPIEFFMFYKNAGGSYEAEQLLNTKHVNKYLSNKEKATAFGIYASDLAYSAVFAQNQQTISYFETGKILADELGFTEGYGEDLMNRFHDNLDNVDSLYNLTADSYWNVFNFLEDQNKTELLSYITVAGWVESLYLAFNSIPHYQQDELMSCLADQQYVIENLSAYLSEVHRQEANNNKIFKMVDELKDTYNLLYENPDNVIMTKAQFDSLKTVVNQNRALLVK